MAESISSTANMRSRFSLTSLLKNAAILLALALLALQSARLIWAIATPQGPVDMPAMLLSAQRFHDSSNWVSDPFFRGAAASQQNGKVTSLSLRLFGTRLNSASGQGSAIIATPDGVQSSYGVGEAIIPGTKLASVAFDHVVIDRGDIKEQLYLDQSVPAPVAAPAVTISRPSNNRQPAITPGIMPTPATPIPSPNLPNSNGSEPSQPIANQPGAT